MSPKVGALWSARRRELAMGMEVVCLSLHMQRQKHCIEKKKLKVTVTLSDWEGRGRGRGKPVLIPVSHATALGSNGRVMKQQSWPPNAPGDEQGGGGKSR